MSGRRFVQVACGSGEGRDLLLALDDNGITWLYDTLAMRWAQLPHHPGCICGELGQSHGARCEVRK